MKTAPLMMNFPVVWAVYDIVPSPPRPSETDLRLSDTTDEAKALFSKGYPVKAAAYDQALKLVVPSDPLAARCTAIAACFMYAKQYADVVVEATRALKTNPSDPAALLYRAKAYELLGQGKKAKADAAAAAADAGDDQQRGFVEAAKAMLAPADAKPAADPPGSATGLAPGKKADTKNNAKEAPLTAAQLAERKAAQARQAERCASARSSKSGARPSPSRPRARRRARGDRSLDDLAQGPDDHAAAQVPDTSAFSVRFTDAEGASKPLNSRADFAAAFVAAQAAKARRRSGRGGGAHAAQPAGPQLAIVEHAAPPRRRGGRQGSRRRRRRRASRPTRWSKSTSGSWISPRCSASTSASTPRRTSTCTPRYVAANPIIRRFLAKAVDFFSAVFAKRRRFRLTPGGDDEDPHDYPERTLTNVLQMSFAPIASRLGGGRRFSSLVFFFSRAFLKKNDASQRRRLD